VDHLWAPYDLYRSSMHALEEWGWSQWEKEGVGGLGEQEEIH
jgi:hypothetical protein